MSVQQEEVLTVKEAATLLKLPEKTVRQKAREGVLPGRKIGKEWRFSRLALLAWLRGSEPDQAYFWTEVWQQKEREADEDIAAGRLYPLSSPDDLDRIARDIGP